MKSFLFCFCLAAVAAAQTASVDGVVVNHVTGEPISGAHVRVLTGDVASISVERVYGAVSDQAGRFAVSGMQPGLYLVVPEHSGYVFTRPAGPIPATVLALRAGQHVTGQKVELTPIGFVSGRVVDEDGDPVSGAPLQLHAAPPDTDFVNPFAIALPYRTDDRGEFRIVVAPGNYYLQTTPWQQFGPTWHPSADRQDQASAIEVKPGQEATADIRLRRAPPPGSGGGGSLLSLSGAVTGSPNRSAIVMLHVRTNTGTFQSFRGSGTDAAGNFTIRGVPPGSYRIFAQYPPGKLQSQVLEMQLSGADTGDVQLALRAGENVDGSVEVNGSAPTRRLTVKLEALEPNGPGTPETAPAEVGKDGTFRVSGVLAGRYRLRVGTLQEGEFIRSVNIGGATVDESGFELSGGAAGPVKILVSNKAGQVSGNVLDRDGRPVTSPLAAVLLWKDAAQVRPEINTVSGGRYALRDVRPGKYRLLAVDAFDFTNLAGAGDADEFAKALLPAAEEIEVGEGARMVKNLKVAAKEDIHVQSK